MAAKKLDYLFHYTTAEGLIGIVEHHELWGSNIFYMNDRSEFFQGLRVITDYLESKEVSKRHGTTAHELAELLKNLGQHPVGGTFFVCSFSEDPDELGQWRAYCSHGGYAIGFPFASIEPLRADKSTWLERCIYSKDKQLAIVENHLNTTGQKSTERPIALVSEALRFKHAAFLNEKEWRLIHAVRDCNDDLFTRYCFRPYNGRIVPYAKFRLKDDATWRKVRVVVGPCPETEMKDAVAAVRSLLGYGDSDAYDKVVPSVIPYRHW